MKGSNLSGVKATDQKKTNEQAVLESLNREIPASDPTHTRNAQNKELDVIVSNLLEQAIAGSDKRQVHSDVQVESENKPSIQSKGKDGKKEASKLDPEPNFDLEFGVAAGSADSSHIETSTQQLQDVSEPVKMDGTAHEAPINTIGSPVIERELSVGETAVEAIDKSSLFSEMESSDTRDEKSSGKRPLNKYAVAGICATIGILICLAAYLKYGRSGSDENLGLMESVAQGQNTAEQPGMPIPFTDQSRSIPAALTTVQSQTVLEQSSGTIDQTTGSKEARLAETDPKIPSKQSKAPAQDDGATLPAKKPGRSGQAVAETRTKGLSSPNHAGEGNTEFAANSQVDRIKNNRNIQREAERPDIQPAANSARGTVTSEPINITVSAAEIASDTDRIVVSEPISISISDSEAGSAALELPNGSEPTWNSIAVLVPESILANIENNKSEIKPDYFNSNTLDVVKEEKASANINKEYKPPVLVSKVNPSYPRMAAQIRETGIVTLKLDINKQGRVVKAEPISGPIVFYEEAVRAVLQWRYRPASRNGNNSDSQVTLSIKFNIQ